KCFAHSLRCHHTGRQHAISQRLAQLIYDVDKHFDFKKILVVAGYRAPRVAREKGNPKSPHKKGLACDFRIEGVPNTELRDYLRGSFERVGVGFYPNSDFVHLDVREKKSAFWVDYSGPGERARYGPERPEPADSADDEPHPSTQSAEGQEPQPTAAVGAPNPNSPMLAPLTP